jgi:dephospho-CoA kinase
MTNNNIILGLVGQKNTGKDTVADYLCSKYGFTKLAFATPIKQMCEAMFDLDACYFEERELKETVIPAWQMTPREMMQQVGTDMVQTHFGQNFWIKHLDQRLQKLLKENHKIVITDVRFITESMYVRSRGGKLVQILSDSETDDVQDNHQSEVQMLMMNCDVEIVNDKRKGKEALYELIDVELDGII